MAWPQCEFRMQVWYVLHAARWKYSTQKNRQKFAIWSPPHKFVGLYLRKWGTYRQSEKNSLNSNISSTCPYIMVNFGPLAAEIVSLVWATPANFNGFLGSVTARYSSSGRQPNFAVLNRGCYLYSAGRPSRWASAHILVYFVFLHFPILSVFLSHGPLCLK